jgi:sugar/nucleoside kinase (ribokinase family)
MVKVVSLGIHIVDVLGRPVSEIPSGQNLALLDEIRMTVAGTAAGTAIDLAKLEMDVYAIGAIGEDALADFLTMNMESYGIHTEGLVRKTGVQTSATMLPIRPNGERPALHVIGANGELVAADVNLGLIQQAEYLHVGGTPLLRNLDGKPLRGILEFAKNHGVTTMYDLLAIPDPNLPAVLAECLPFVDYFMPGLDEAKMISNLDDEEDVCRFYLDQGAGHVVFKSGENGSVIGWMEDTGLKTERMPAFEVPVVDSTGCGDSYCAGFIKGLSLGWSLKESARLGSACGALVIQGLGSDAGIVDLKSTLDFMDSVAIKARP